MAKLNKTDKSGIGLGAGILMPQLKHQWRLKFTGKNIPFTIGQRDKFVMQMVSCSFDYHLKTLTLVFEQDAFTSDLHNIVKKFSTFARSPGIMNRVSFLVDMLDGSNKIINSFSFEDCVLIAHSFDLDYADYGTTKHKIKFSYKTTKEI